MVGSSASIAEPLHEVEKDHATTRNVFALLERNSFYQIRPVPRGINRPLLRRERIGSGPVELPEALRPGRAGYGRGPGAKVSQAKCLVPGHQYTGPSKLRPITVQWKITGEEPGTLPA